MPRASEQKIKLLILYDILLKNTDEEHPMTTGEIASALESSGIPATRKTIYRDIETLNSYGFEILCERGRSNRYYVADRKFERPEVQILLQAVGAAKFLSEKKTSALSYKIAELLGASQAEDMIGTVTESDTKSGNEHVYYNIDAVTSALLEKKKLSFRYFDTDLHGGRTYRKNGERYIVNSLGLIYAGDNFYLICFHDKYTDVAAYRIDRMEGAQAEREKVAVRKEFEHFDVNAYRRETFSMYAGEQTEVELLFPSDLEAVARDRFGENCTVVTDREGTLVRTKVRVSKPFFAWLTTFEGRVRIVRPAEVKQAFAGFVERIAHNMK